jgi:hypothetical protein
MLTRIPSAALALALSCACLPGQEPPRQDAAPQPMRAEIGARLDFTFAQPLLEGRGTRSLRELRGKAVLIEFWGRN